MNAQPRYQSANSFATQMAVMTRPSRFLSQYLPRTLREDSQATFERHLHDAMRWSSHTVDTDGF